MGTNHVETLIIGAGQAGLSTGYHLRRLGRPFLIVDAHDEVGEVWRERWDSLRLFTPARYDSLPGMAFPAPGFSFPTKDQMADYLRAYAERFALDVQTGVRVDGVTKTSDGFLVDAGPRQYTADNVVVAMGTMQEPVLPAYAADLDPAIVQLHSSAYRNPEQLRAGRVLIVGAGNSGAEIGVELARTHEVVLAGRDTGHVPFRIGGTLSRLLLSRIVIRFVFHRLLTVATPIGRKARTARAGGAPLIRTRPQELAAAGVVRTARMTGVQDGLPLLEDGQVIQAANVVWCTGYQPGFSWLNIPILDGTEPRHVRGIVPEVPGLYFTGLHFLYAFSSGMVQGAGRDAERIAKAVAARPIPVREPAAVQG
ncbi:MAG: NAD(P)-binding domain-containing protein [Hamadaea sp.]|uniref:flavin-containing monooxygenase n=1 Tax=Hamadaea sp. TaxID=2024425 RepID=UPI00185F152F|nr:NAD(P)/FAD-dependent oxidoreductase [Hamadaea sp.]NUR71715.1 NAD(P)-binding domain-containing protein [Hamadaea sp.]NUT19029.1 NAD(P)-binding domain-containing protein [Hamadaea sp.]